MSRGKLQTFEYFSASESFDSTFPTNVVVTSEGLCTYIPPGMFKSSCPIDITWFPFDDQSCDMKFGSWTYNGFKVTPSDWIGLGIRAKKTSAFLQNSISKVRGNCIIKRMGTFLKTCVFNYLLK